jgi:hypothetical protein
MIMLVAFFMLEGARNVIKHNMNEMYNMECRCHWYSVRVGVNFITDARVHNTPMAETYLINNKGMFLPMS